MDKDIQHKTVFSEFNLESQDYFKLYSCCIPVKGLNRGVIFDLQRGNFHFFPNILLELLENFSNKQLFHEYAEQKTILIRYFNYLTEHDLIFRTEDPLNFPPISKNNYSPPSYLDFLSIEISHLQSYKKDLLKNIDSLGVRELIIIQKNFLIDNIIEALKLCVKSKLTRIIIVMAYSDKVINTELVQIIESNSRIHKWVFYNTEFTTDFHTKVVFKNKTLMDVLCKRIESYNDFVINTKSYIESCNYNLYFNKRAYVEDDGFVKHSFDDKVFYGNIRENKLSQIISTKEFQNLWSITKDQVKECLDCEFRFVCPDNRIPEIINDNDYDHRDSCQYNPRTNNWLNEEV